LAKSRTKPPPSLPPVPTSNWREAIAGDRIAHLVRGVHRGLLRSFQIRLYEHGVAHGHWTFLRVLWRTDGLTQKQLSDLAGVMEPTTFSAVKAMEKLGYVVRQEVSESRKQVRIFLTRKGAALRNVLVPVAEELNAMALQDIPITDVVIARRVLLAMIENLSTDEMASWDRNLRMPSTRELARTAADAVSKNQELSG
jgi:MarR family transcriptional regulator, organic hydroperoxide resistance regulator